MITFKYNTATVHIDGLEIRTEGTELDYARNACPSLSRSVRFATAQARPTAAAEALEGAAKLAASLGKKLCKHCVSAAEAQAAAEAAAVKPARRAAQGASSATGWELLYDKPKQGCEVGRRTVEGKSQYALICKAHGHVHELPSLTAERAARRAGGWCPSC